MIEEFMLAANEAVARELARRGLPFPHRVHEPPAADSVAALARFLEGFGLRLRLEEGRPTPAAFQAVLEQVQGRPEERLVNTVLLRSMQQARYAGRRSATSASPPPATPTSPRPSAATPTWSCTASSGRGACRPTCAPSPRSPRGASAWRWRPSARSSS